VATQGTNKLAHAFTLTALPAGYIVAANGSDSNAGTRASPYASMTHCRDVMKSGNKYCYFRGGTYTNWPNDGSGCTRSTIVAVMLHLGSSENGETYSYYPYDGLNTAIFDDQATNMNSGHSQFGMCLQSAQNVTVIGLEFDNFAGAGLFDYTCNAPGGNNKFLYNKLVNSYGQQEDVSGNPGAIWLDSYVAGDQVMGNLIVHAHSMGIVDEDVVCLTSHGMDNTVIQYNMVIDACNAYFDCGSIYINDQEPGFNCGTTCLSVNIKVDNNYILQSGGQCEYSDDDASNISWTHNIAIACGHAAYSYHGMIHGGMNLTHQYELIDLIGSSSGQSTGNPAASFLQDSNFCGLGRICTGMSGNHWNRNIYICRSGDQPCGNGWTVDGGHNPPNAADVSNNQYWNYQQQNGGVSGVNDSCQGGGNSCVGNSDQNPHGGDPKITGLAACIDPSSPVYSTIGWIDFTRTWGPHRSAIVPTQYTSVTPSWGSGAGSC
jgi:hypothetical protein